MSDNPPYPPQGGQPPYGPPPGAGQPPEGYPQGPPGYGASQPTQAFPAPGQPGQPYGQPAYGTPYGQPGYGEPPKSKKWYQRWWVWLVAVIAVIIIALVVVGVVFGSTKYQLESKIKDAAKKQGVTISSVHCPDSINTDEGNTYTCTAVIDGKSANLLVKFVSDRNFTITQEQ
jgi:hypothetical protein